MAKVSTVCPMCEYHSFQVKEWSERPSTGLLAPYGWCPNCKWRGWLEVKNG